MMQIVRIAPIENGIGNDIALFLADACRPDKGPQLPVGGRIQIDFPDSS
jgi:hypothetical protein